MASSSQPADAACRGLYGRPAHALMSRPPAHQRAASTHPGCSAVEATAWATLAPFDDDLFATPEVDAATGRAAGARGAGQTLPESLTGVRLQAGGDESLRHRASEHHA